jgi:hypothetical protein
MFSIRSLASVTALLVSGCTAHAPPTAQPPSGPVAPASEPAGVRFDLPTIGRVFVPDYVPARLDQPDLLVHFHGWAPTVQREFAAAGLRAVLVTVNYKGLSAAYEKPFSDPALFQTVLDETLTELRRRGRVVPDSNWRRVCVSSFSAGFGAVRAVLSVPRYFERINGLYLADTLYAGYVEVHGTQQVNPEHVHDFRRYAAEALAGRKTLIITHSYLVPGGYAGTHETAADLLHFVELAPEAADEPGPSGMRIVSRAARGGLLVLGCAGTTGEDHMAHLRNLRAWLALLPLESVSRR